jgi:5-methylcytosine-specific restriction endonuclease McrA
VTPVELTFQGKPCVHCRGTTRYRSSRGCVVCSQAKSIGRVRDSGIRQGRKCVRCGGTARYNKNGSCVTCLSNKTAQRDKANPERQRAKGRSAYNNMTDARWLRSRVRSMRTGTKRRLAKLGLAIELPSIDTLHAWASAEARVCAYCKSALTRSNTSFDHALPLSRGGDTAPANLRLACKPCNNAKGTMTDGEFAALRGLVTTWPDGGKSVMVRLRLGAFNVRR